MTDGSIVINTALDNKGIIQGLSSINRSVNTSVNNATNTALRGINQISNSLMRIKRLIPMVFGVGSLVLLGKEALELSSSITEVDNVVEKAFGNMRSEMDALANQSIETLGMSRLTAYQTGSMFMQFGKTMVGDTQKAKDMALELTKLTGNLASFRNESADVIKTRLKGIYTGETEAIEELGISLKVATLNQYALSKGMSTTYDKMTEGEKILLRYQYVMEQLEYVGNDFLDTQDSWANQTRILKENWKEFLTVIGDGLVSVLTPIIKAMNTIISQMITLAKYVGSLLGKFFNIQKQTVGSNNSASDSYDDLSSSVGDYEDAVNSASKSTSKALGKFDELNQMTTKSGSGSSGGSSLNVGDIEVGDIITAEDIKEQIDNALKSFEDLGSRLSTAIENGLKKIPWSKIESEAKKLGENIAKTLNGFFENQGSAKEIGNAIAQMINTGVGLAYGFVSTFKFKAFGQWLGTLVEEGVKNTDWEMIGSYMGKKVNGIADSVSGFFDTFHSNNLSLGISKMFNTAIDEVDEKKVASAIGVTLWNAFNLVEGIFKQTHFDDAVAKINKIFSDVLTYDEENETLGIKVGSTLASIINEGIDIVINGNIEEAISSFMAFFRDMMVGAIESIDPRDIVKALEKIIIGIPMEIANSFAREVTISLLDPFLSDDDIKNIRERMATAEDTAQSFGEDMRKLLHLDNELSVGEQYVKNYNDALTELNKKSNEFTADGLTKIQEKYGLADEAIDRLISTLSIQYSEMQLANRGLEDYNGNWELFNKRLNASEERQQTTKRNQELIADAMEDTTKAVKKYIDIGEKADNSGLEKSLDSVKEKTEEVGIAFTGLTEETQKSLDDISDDVNKWFEETIKPTFSTDTWEELAKNISTPLSESLTGFIESWNEQMTEWQKDNTESYFGYDVWNDMITDNILKAYDDTWKIFTDDWHTNIDTWKTDFVDEYFNEELWTSYGENMKNGIVNGFKAVATEVGAIINSLTDMFNSQMDNISNAVNGIISSVNASASQTDVPTLSSISWSHIPKVQVPQFATGTVLPPNNPFMAIVGDNKRETEVISPLSTMVDAFNKANNNGESVAVLKEILEVLINKETGITDSQIFNSVQKSARRYSQTTGRFAF